MDADTIKTLSDILHNGGSAALFVALFYAAKAGKTALDAVESLERIDKVLQDALPSLKSGAEKLDKIATAVDDIDRRTQSQDLKLAALRTRQAP